MKGDIGAKKKELGSEINCFLPELNADFPWPFFPWTFFDYYFFGVQLPNCGCKNMIGWVTKL